MSDNLSTAQQVDQALLQDVDDDSEPVTVELDPEEGAETALLLALLPEDGPTGGFFRRRQPIAW